MKGSRITSMWRIGLLPLAIASSTILASCSTTPTTGAIPPVPRASSEAKTGGLFVPCSTLSIVRFNAPNPADPTVVETAANIFDTPETISPTRKNNASIREACGK